MYPDEIERVSEMMAERIIWLYFPKPKKPKSAKKGQRPSNMRKAHDTAHCMACKAGKCVYKPRNQREEGSEDSQGY